MPELRNLSAREVIKTFKKFGFEEISRKGSHIKLRRMSPKGNKQTLTVPNHKKLVKGTLKSIYNQALQYISEDNLKNHFYTES